jgi:hypothetical protein
MSTNTDAGYETDQRSYWNQDKPPTEDQEAIKFVGMRNEGQRQIPTDKYSCCHSNDGN